MHRAITARRTAALLGSAADVSPAYRGIADSLQLLIADGRIPPGTRLPSERELTVALEVSRTTVSRAYAELKDRGYLVARQGSGSVTRVPHRRDAAADPLLPGGSDSDLIDLTCAAPVAPTGIIAAFGAATEQLPSYLSGSGYYPTGLPALREAIAQQYLARGLPTSPDQIIVTPGALAAAALIARTFASPGDRVVTESPTYPNAVATLQRAGTRVVGISVDPDGWDLSSVRSTIRGVRPRLAYLVPDFHNPTGRVLDDAGREALAATLRKAGTLPIIDETLVDLPFGDGVPPAAFATWSSEALTIGSSSKSFWGGLRVGWIRASEQRIGDLVASRLTLDLGTPLVEQLAVAHLLEHGSALVEERRAQLRRSLGALTGALARDLPEWRFISPDGGMSLWCELPAARSSALAVAAADQDVALIPGPSFAVEGGLERFIRIPFAADADRLERAVPRLALAWENARSSSRGKPPRRHLVA